MNLFEKISRLFTSPAADTRAYWVTVKCSRCGEVIRARVDLLNDLSTEYGEKEGDLMYFCRKGLMGEQRCYQVIEVELTFDAKRRLIERQAHGGEFVDPAA